jgi:carbon-monoxide dehydrogenase medium subunit
VFRQWSEIDSLKPVDFEYARPADLDAALALIGDNGSLIKVVAGSQSLGPMLNLRLVQPDLLVDITGIEALRGAAERRDEVVIGACVTHADIEDGRVPDATRGALPTVASGIAYRAVRNRGTVGGSLTHADPSADWVSMLSAVGASVTLHSRSQTRTIPVENYIVGALESDLKPGELLISVNVPKFSRSARWGYYKTCRKTGEFAHAIGAFVVDPERNISRAVMGATGSRPIVVADARRLLGDGTPGHFQSAAAYELAESAGMSDPIDRKLHVVALRRAVEQARVP